MGYDIHITRADHWADSDKNPITLEEWLAYVGTDPEMRHDGFAEATTTGGGTLRIEADGISVWTAYSGHESEGNMAWFSWYGGDIRVKNPDEEIRRKMYRIGKALNAHVQGDEGELYDEHGDSDWR